MDRRQRLAELLSRWEDRAARGEPVSATDLCRDHPDLLPDIQKLIQLEAGWAEAPTALRDRPEASATDVAAPVPPGDVGGWLAPARGPGELGRLGKYRILRVVRSGGMGVVLEGEDPTLKRRVAIKVMHPRLAADPAARARFLREAEALARLDHEHVVPVYEAAEDPAARVAYLVMPFLKGEPLDARLKREGRLPVGELIRIGREAAAGLQAVHDRGLIHRDVKPSNLWLDPRGKVKLLDFGLARVGDPDPELSVDGRVVGTPAYMAPEQARGDPVDHRADLFALGCTLYRMATGSVPFVGPSSVATLYSITAGPAPDPQAANPALPAGLAALIKRLLARDPSDRPSSAAAVARDLAELEPGEEDTQVPLATAVPLPAPADPWSDIDTPDVGKPPPPPARRPWRRIAPAVVAAVLVVVGGMGAVYLLRPPRGTVTMQAADAEADGRLRGARVQLADDDGRMFALEPGERSRSVPPGAYRVMILGERLDPSPARIEVRRGETTTVRVVGTPPMPKPPGPGKKPPPAADAAAAEWVHGLGGTLELVPAGDKPREVGPGDALPPGPFTVRAIRLHGVEVAGGLFRLGALAGLEELDLTDCRLADSDLADVGAVTTLKRLAVRADKTPGRVTDGGLVHLGKLTRLERLTLAGQPVTDGGLEKLADLAALKEVDFTRSKVTGRGLAHLHKSSGLHTVRGLGAPTDAGVAALARFPGLTHLDLGAGGEVTDAGLKHLAALTRLETLIVHNARLTDTGLKALTGLKKLRGLGADGSELTDTGLAHLKAFPELAALGIEATAVSDDGLKTLAEMKTLQWLNLRRTRATAAAVKALQAALPECEVRSDFEDP